MAHTAELACGASEAIIQAVWNGSTRNAIALARLGLETLPGVQCAKVAPGIDPNIGVLQPGVEVADIHNRIMSLVCIMLEVRFRLYAVHPWPCSGQ